MLWIKKKLSDVAEHREGVCADIVVDEDDRTFGLLDEADDLGIGIEYLAVVEDALDRWQRRAHEEIDFVFEILYLGILLSYMLF